MGVHTGDSITVAPALTLTDKEYQRMRDAARRIIRRVGVETGGSNIQFAVNPADGRMIVIEMNPRVSRSSALASKATGFPIAKIAAKLALGYHLDEIPNDITRLTPASFEPTIDYVVVKIPRWNFEKFPQADRTLTTQMKSVGEAMAIGRTFKEAFMKAFRSLELGSSGLLFGQTRRERRGRGRGRRRALQQAAGDADRPADVGGVPRARARLDRRGDPRADEDRSAGSCTQFAADRRAAADRRRWSGCASMSADLLRTLKRAGFGDAELARLLGIDEDAVRAAAARARARAGLQAHRHLRRRVRVVHAVPVQHVRARRARRIRTPRKKVVILGSGPNRIGQGIEFDYCCCHAAFALARGGLRDGDDQLQPGDGLDRLRHRRPAVLRAADVRGRDGGHRARAQRPAATSSCVVQFGGQTPLKLALALQDAGVTILGTSPDSIDLAEDRKRFSQLLSGPRASRSRRAARRRRARRRARSRRAIGFPVVVRPSYVLGGRGMAIVYDVGDARSLHDAAPWTRRPSIRC